MTANFQNDLIIVKGEDKTTSIQSWKFDNYKPVVYITYSNGKSYPYNTNDVLFLKYPKNIAISNQLVYYKGCSQYGLKMIQLFDSYCRLIYKSSHSKLCFAQDIKIIGSALDDENAVVVLVT